MLLLETPFSQQDENDPVDSFPTSAFVNTVDSFPTSAFVNTIKLEGILNQYKVDHYGKTAYNESIEGSEVTPLLLLNTVHRVVDNNNDRKPINDSISLMPDPYSNKQ